jgi:hypothetical protein
MQLGSTWSTQFACMHARSHLWHACPLSCQSLLQSCTSWVRRPYVLISPTFFTQQMHTAVSCSWPFTFRLAHAASVNALRLNACLQNAAQAAYSLPRGRQLTSDTETVVARHFHGLLVFMRSMFGWAGQITQACCSGSQGGASVQLLTCDAASFLRPSPCGQCLQMKRAWLYNNDVRNYRCVVRVKLWNLHVC